MLRRLALGSLGEADARSWQHAAWLSCRMRRSRPAPPTRRKATP
jgi:hypothetical protein